jgi:hypothetical protein
MWRGQILFWSDRDYTGGIDGVVGDIVVPLDMVEVDGMGDPVGLVEVSEVTEEVRVVPDSSDITLKMAMVDHIEPHQGDKEPPVGLNEL